MIDRRALLKQSGAVMAALGTASVFDPLRAFADTDTRAGLRAVPPFRMSPRAWISTAFT